MGKTYRAEGETIIEAISNLNVGNAYKGAGLLMLEKGEVKKEKVLFPSMILRLFGPASPMSKEVITKQVGMLFDKSVFE